MKNQKSNLYSRLNLALLSILFSIFLFQFSCTQNTASNKLKINEVWTKGGDSPVGGFLHNFVELYNKDSVAISVSGWTLANRTGAVIATLPNWVLPPKTYLTVYFGSGQDDDDFSDREGSYYTQGDSLNIFDDVMDEVGLYTGRPSGSSIIDFVAWSNTGNYTPGVAHAHALSKGIWTQGDFVDRSGYGILSSHGLCPDGFDHNVSGDWREYDWGTYFISTTHSGPNPIQLSPLDGQILSALQVNFLWAAVDSALSYRLQVDDDSTFVSPEIDTVLSTTSYSDRLAPGDYYWRVRVIDRQGLVEEAAIWSFGIFPVLPPGPPARRLNVPSLFQHKDTDMLCLTDDTGLNPRIRRPGCSEFPSNSGPWDGAHPNNHALVCPHCGWYCVRASLAMINRYYGGDMSQDRISYQACKDLTAGEPEQDLGHERGLYFVPDEITPVYSWVLNGAAVAFRLGKPSFNTIRNEIDANRPIGIVIPGNMMALDGYRVSLQNQVYILDP